MPTDYLNDETGDLAVANGDLVKGDATEKHQYDLLMTEPGQCREFPTVGVGINSFLNNEKPADLLREIRKQFAADGMKVNQVNIDQNGKVQIDAEYNE